MVLEDGPGEAVSVLGEKWVMCTEVWHGEKGYKKLFDGPTILPKCTEKWPGGEKMLGPKTPAKSKRTTKKPVKKKTRTKAKK
jgi:hypothetical protein